MKGDNAAIDILKDVNGITVTKVVEEAMNAFIFIQQLMKQKKIKVQS